MPQDRPALPWWRFPIMWLVVGGPALVVVASAATFVVALRGGDTPLPATAAAEAPLPLKPAMQARNHAAVPAR